MLNFAIIITCATGISCPLGSMTITKSAQFKSQSECLTSVRNGFAAYGYDANKFHYRCEKAK